MCDDILSSAFRRNIFQNIMLAGDWAGKARFPIIIMALIVSGCDERQALCDKAVEAAMKSKASYKLLEVIPDWQERSVEGKGISSYKYIYRYYNCGYETDIRVGLLECNYVDECNNQVSLFGNKEIECAVHRDDL